MEYLISFLEGIITFISPCLLPMLPVYISYFAGGFDKEVNSKNKTFTNALGFVVGFTIVFIILGAFAGTIGKVLIKYEEYVNIITGSIVVIFGLNYLGIIKVGFLNKTARLGEGIRPKGFLSSVVFGIIFSIGWTPCIGAFLGSALTLAAMGAHRVKGMIMLFCFSMGLGIPFIVSALLIDRLKGAINFIKRNYRVINIVSGIFLIAIGVLMISGYMGKFLSMIS